jgi:hypothetical protein
MFLSELALCFGTFSSLTLAAILSLAKIRINFALHKTTTEVARQGNTT